MQNFILINKILLLAFWAIFIVDLIWLVHIAILPIGLLMGVIHAVEFFWQRKALKDAGESDMQALVQTLLFGVLYWHYLVKRG
ncbi:MAG: hypothetical protein L7S59_04855 [Pseudomonadales bacterium]|nr:hypothetical protein [Pseudomonadales bacterium]